MIPFARVPEPATFDAEVRRPGRIWLEEHPDKRRPRPLWTPFIPVLADGFRNLCGYSAMHVESGTVDHYISCFTDRMLAYEWENYRFASERMNSIKRTADSAVLDPFIVQEGWFEILLPSLQMVLTERVPPEYRQQAEYTLRRLRLRDDERIIRRRAIYRDLFLEGKLSLPGLQGMAPLIAWAVEKRLVRLKADLPGEAEEWYGMFLKGGLTLAGLRDRAPALARIIVEHLTGADP
jgi:hypothetical protein